MTGGSRAGPPEPISTHVGFGTAVDHMEGAVGQVEASEAAGSLKGGAKHTSQISDIKAEKGVTHTQRGTTDDGSCLATTDSWRRACERGYDVIWDCGQPTDAM